MNSVELIKKTGAGLVIIVISVMMLITFSSQPIDEILAIIAGNSKIGSFYGKEIQPEVYFWTRDYCKRTYERYGNVPEQFINNCASEQLKQLYSLSSMGSKLGVRSSKKNIEKRLYDDIKSFQSAQGRYLDPDDRLSVEEIYRREITQNPISTRQMVASAGLSADLLSSPMPVPSSIVKASQSSENIKMNFKLIKYSTAELLQSLGNNITIPESEIKAEYDRRERLKDGKNPATYESQKELIENDLKTGKKQQLLGDIKKQLSEMKTPDLKKISEFTHKPIIDVKNVSLNELKSVSSPAGSVNLARAEILSNPVKGVYGPFQEGDSTVYAELTDINNLPQKTEKNIQDIEKNISSSSGRELFNFLLENEARTGNFSLNPALTSAN